MIEVELQKHANVLLDFFINSYEKHYKSKHISMNISADITVCKDLIRSLGFEKARSVIEQYLKTKDDWFLKKGHGLDVLKSNINVVLSRLPKQSGPKENPILKIWLSCDRCSEYYWWIGKVGDLETERSCETCNQAGEEKWQLLTPNT